MKKEDLDSAGKFLHEFLEGFMGSDERCPGGLRKIRNDQGCP